MTAHAKPVDEGLKGTLSAADGLGYILLAWRWHAVLLADVGLPKVRNVVHQRHLQMWRALCSSTL